MKQARQIPLNALRVFDAVMRLSSFTKAGEDLGITQTAVSYQIRILEEMLDTPLFLRRPRRIEPTETALRLAPDVAESFARLHEALAKVMTTSAETLVVATTPTFAAHWLAGHIGEFQLRVPHMAVRMIADSNIVDFASEAVDVAIRYGAGGQPGLVEHELMQVDYAPMVSPRLLEREGPLRDPRDLLRLRLIDPSDPWWRTWFDAAGVPDADLESRPSSRLGAQAYVAKPAIAGHGVAILTPAFHKAELAAGLLVQPFPLVCGDHDKAYRLVYPDTRRRQPKIRAFCDWLLGEMADTPV